MFTNLQDASLNLNSLNVNNDCAAFSWIVKYNGQEYQINANGTVGKGHLVGSGLVGNLIDNTGNFQVAYFTIEDKACR